MEHLPLTPSRKSAFWVASLKWLYTNMHSFTEKHRELGNWMQFQS